MSELKILASLLARASGADEAIDHALAAAFATDPAPYSSSVDDCRRLAGRALPGWRLHVGYGAGGLFPYAALVLDESRAMAEAPTVPLAILRALVDAALSAQQDGK